MLRRCQAERASCCMSRTRCRRHATFEIKQYVYSPRIRGCRSTEAAQRLLLSAERLQRVRCREVPQVRPECGGILLRGIVVSCERKECQTRRVYVCVPARGERKYA